MKKKDQIDKSSKNNDKSNNESNNETNNKTTNKPINTTNESTNKLNNKISESNNQTNINQTTINNSTTEKSNKQHSSEQKNSLNTSPDASMHYDLQPNTSSLQQIPRNIWILSWVSLFQNSSSIISSSLSVTLIKDILGGSNTDVGLIRGLTEGLAYFIKLFSGILSDYLGKRKIIILIGYACAAFTKPVFAFVNSIWMYATAQTLDRIANGLRDTPRDALVTDCSPRNLRGICFGIRQGFSQIGSAIGALLGFFVLHTIGCDQIRIMYLLATIPIFFAVIILYFGLQEPKNIPQLSQRVGFPIKLSDMKMLGMKFWYFIFVATIFLCARFSESLLVNQAKNIGIGAEFHTLILFVLYACNAPMSHIAGYLCDRVGRKTFFIIGIIMLIIANLMIGFAATKLQLILGVAVWGGHFGATQVVLNTMVSDYSPEHLKGTSFGIFNLVSAIGIIVASICVGKLCDTHSAELAFSVVAGIAGLSLIGVLFLPEPLQLGKNSIE